MPSVLTARCYSAGAPNGGHFLNATALQDRRAAAEQIAREGGTLALDYFRNLSTLAVESKGPQDVVSVADREVEDLLRERLLARFPGDGMLGEERGLTEGAAGNGIWVVDPIDGTASFVTGIPAWCVSVAYVVGREIELGVVFDPCHDEMYVAARGAGAELNGAPIHASTAGSIADGVVGIGFSGRTAPAPVHAFMQPLLAGGGMYFRNGSGALMIAYVAAGRLIGYYEAHINSWDCLGGLALVREAGGWTSDFLANDGLMKGNHIIAAAPGVAADMRRCAGID